MSLHREIHRRVPVPFDYAKRQFETETQRAVGDDWPAFLAYWAGLNYDAAEAFVNVAGSRAEAFRVARDSAREATNA